MNITQAPYLGGLTTQAGALDFVVETQEASGVSYLFVTGLLREMLGYGSAVCTDWGLITESRLHGKQLPPRA
ncbi:hypothetical protein [Sinomonas sp.]|jgi:beta-glucosidase|uniref:hypothetical protein n=1 Tax=Sinomonas sp. TaxID=1914986 RepID=UPI003F7DB073